MSLKLLLLTALVFYLTQANLIQSFQDCVQAGYSVTNSNPRECHEPNKVWKEESQTFDLSNYCGWSLNGQCSSQSDCTIGGCSGQICGNQIQTQDMISTCEWRDCYSSERHQVECTCAENVCKWVNKKQTSEKSHEECVELEDLEI